MQDEMPTARGTEQYPVACRMWGVIGCNFKKLIFFPREKSKYGRGRPSKAEAERRLKEREKSKKAKNVTGERYRQEVLAKVVPDLKRRNAVFMEDGAPAHRDKDTVAYLVKAKVRQLANWPPRSPDLNPIETLWAIIARAVANRGPYGEEELQAFVQQEWENIPMSTINKLVLSFKGRCAKMKLANGGVIKP
jgi:transposase